jgi:hypothetical protein
VLDPVLAPRRGFVVEKILVSRATKQIGLAPRWRKKNGFFTISISLLKKSG